MAGITDPYRLRRSTYAANRPRARTAMKAGKILPENSASPLRDVLARRALAEIPRLLTLQDRTPVSPTYGSFDRMWWHYRVMDFPTGMSQKEVLPLALAWSLDIPGNPYFRQPEIRNWIEAGIRFAARASHPDGSCDDYYPFERAAGAAAFSLIAFLDASEIIGLHGDPEIDAFLKLRANWLATHAESGRLSNHEALIAACLQRMLERFGDEWEAPFRKRLGRLLSWQHREGWFAEYEGADPGYTTLTIALLADLDRRRPELGLRDPCERAIRFIHSMLHPDGTLGGEYTSRCTLNFFVHGFEIAGSWCPLGLAINDAALPILARGENPAVADDRIFGHHVTSWLMAWKEWQAERPGPSPLPDGRVIYQDAKLLIEGRGDQRLYLGWSHGGAFRLFDKGRLLLADTGPTLAMKSGRVAVTHLEAENKVELGADRIVIEGQMAWAKSALLTPVKSIIFRALMITVGRWFPDLIRRLLQRMLVTGRKPAPFRFRRILEWQAGRWTLKDEVIPENGWDEVAQAGIGGFQCSMTTVVARVWQPAQLQPWLDLTPATSRLGAQESLTLDRVPEFVA